MTTSPTASGPANDGGRGALWSLIQGHLDRTAITERAFARQSGLKHQTLNAWKHRAPHQLPHRRSLNQIAGTLGIPYLEVLAAALYDAGFVDDRTPLDRGDPTATLNGEQRRVVLTLIDLLRGDGT